MKAREAIELGERIAAHVQGGRQDEAYALVVAGRILSAAGVDAGSATIVQEILKVRKLEAELEENVEA